MSKSKGAGDSRETEAERSEKNHMDRFRRLAAVKNMHGKPGERKKKTH